MTNRIQLAQVFNTLGEYTPTKADLYLKRVGFNDATSFVLNNKVTVIDASNFLSITESGHKLFLDEEDGSSGAGAMRVKSFTAPLTASNFSILEYPVSSSTSGKFYSFMLIKTPTGNINATIYLDGDQVDTVSETGLASGWVWVAFSFVLFDNKYHTLQIRIEESEALIDKIYIDSDVETEPDEYVATEATESPYVTVHFKLYDTDVNQNPNNADLLYSYKNTIDDILKDDWYSFPMEKLHSSVSLSMIGDKAIVLSSSGGKKNNYVIWETVEADEYDATPSAIKYEDV